MNPYNLLKRSLCTPVWSANEPPTLLSYKEDDIINWFSMHSKSTMSKDTAKNSRLIHTTWNNIWLLSGGELSVLFCLWIHVNSCVEINVIEWKSSNTKKVTRKTLRNIIVHVYNEMTFNYCVTVYFELYIHLFLMFRYIVLQSLYIILRYWFSVAISNEKNIQ